MTLMPSFLEKLNAGAYDERSYGIRPQAPPVLNKRAKDLSNDEMKSLASVRADFEKQLRQYNATKESAQEYNSSIRGKVEIDMLAEFGYSPDSKAGRLIFSTAYEHGHSSGWYDVHNWFSELHDLVVAAHEELKRENT